MTAPTSQTRLVCLLGMHRSGTSYLAGELAHAGLYLGSANRAGSPFNAKGNQENQAIVTFHETVLKAAGGSWDKPSAKIQWAQRHRERAMELAQAYPADRLCGFKDPRTLLHLHEWQSLPLALQPVGIFRDPQAVADSLHRRDAIPPDLALKLWETYNQRLLDTWQAAPFPLIDFDLPDDELKRSIGRVADWLGLLNRDKAGFFDAALRHHNPQPNPLKRQDSPVYQLHRQLQEAAVSFWTLAGTTAASN